MLVCASLTKNRRLEVGPVAPVAASVWPIPFPCCRAPDTSWRLRQTFCGTSRGVGSSGSWCELGFGNGDLLSDRGQVEGGVG